MEKVVVTWLIPVKQNLTRASCVKDTKQVANQSKTPFSAKRTSLAISPI